ncbi:DUF262 domain-containing protein [Anabaena catenula]|uniref:DUF262 domain-containing protein n=1 Tax=Anabaena catenula FACHB-362 TaxID=2692877 RepID=A0ABR8IZH4_9NOST|nr:DUF262 domain-containing protein [Anabaena catenula]MBD2690738.1 DUF262 domain-containing protein [Anabaena catenula FACHB-362]
MSTIPTIESRNLSLSTIFQDFYIVPDFQREYVWQKDQVQKLLEDLFEGLGLDEGDTTLSEYFLGSIVVYPDSTDDKQTFQLIDGQQRLTTIYLIFCVIRDSIKKLGDNSKAIEGYLQGTTQSTDTGEDIDKPRLSLQYDSFGQKVINDYILDGQEPEKLLLQSSASADNIAKAWKVIKKYFSENLEEDIKLYKKVSTAIANRTKLIRIETPNLTNALKVFETINERGIGLTPVDLLKNYLFIHTAKEQARDRHWQALTKKWEELLKLLYENKQQPLQFLRYYLMSHYEVDLSNSFPEEEIYDWFLKYGEQQGIQSNPVKFLDDLILAADHYCKFSQGKNIDGSDNLHLKAIGKIQGRVKAHLLLLLGGHFLEKAIFEKLSYYIENLFFIISITRKTRRKDFNITREFAIWSRELRCVKTIENLDDFVDKYFIPQITELKDEFQQSVSQTSGSNLAKYRLRYLLAKITQYVEKEAFGHSESLDFYLDKSITIEHILPQAKQDSYSSKLGNLTLLEKTINSSISDKNYQNKLLGYQQSKILITRSLAEKPHVGNNTQINRAMVNLGLIHFGMWDYEAINKRQEILVNIAMKVWGLDRLDIF